MIPLPIDPLLPDIVSAVRRYDRVVLTATPGAGKTTRLPAELLNSVQGKIAILEPRRLAAVGAAQRVAEERAWKLGEAVGYQVRFESKATSTTRLIFMTDAVLTRRLARDPELRDFDLIVIDEFHERNLNQDLILGVVKELQDLDRKIKLLVMSATLDTEQLMQFLPDAHMIDVPGTVFPLEIRHIKQATRPVTDEDFIQRVASTTASLVNENRGDILVFLPGVGEVHRVHDRLVEKNLNRDLLPLHGSLPLAEQRLALQPAAKPRIVLATNIAEASVTVPGTDTVVDSGLAKVSSLNLKTGFEKLSVTRIAAFNARQRAGRAARQKAGLCVRLWTAFEEASFDEQMAPECRRVDLSQTLLLLAHLGIRDFKNFAWLETPPDALFNLALGFLKSVDALDQDNTLTATGRKLLELPLSPRWGRALLAGQDEGVSELGALTAALLADRDILKRGTVIRTETESDVLFRLQLLQDLQKGQRVPALQGHRAHDVLATAKQLGMSGPTAPLDANALKKILLISQPDRLTRRRRDGQKRTDRGVMVGGRGVRLADTSQVKTSEFFLSLQAVDLPGQADTVVTVACGLEKSFVLEVLKDGIDTHEDIYFDEHKGRFFNRRVRKFFDLELDEPSLTPIEAAALGGRFVQALADRWEWIVKQDPHLSAWMGRWKFLCACQPDFADSLTKDHVRQALEGAAFGKIKVDEVLQENLVHWLESSLDRDTVTTLKREAPAQFTAASGRTYPIQYTTTEQPFVEVRLQEMFGVLENPRLAFGEVPLTFKLLAPNYRPAQVTADIASFWRNAYFEVRKELRSRYPKHAWPEDPLTAQPVAKGPGRKK